MKRRRSPLVNVISNPVTRAIEKAAMRQFVLDSSIAFWSMPEGTPCKSLLIGLSKTVISAIKAIEGMDDPHGIGDDFLLCVEQMIDASERGYTWRVSDAAAFENALRAAVDILQGVSPVEMLDATVWVNQCGSVLA